MRKVALLFNPETAPYAHHYLSYIQTAAPAFGVTANAISVRSVAEMEKAVEGHAREAGTALVALPDGFTLNNRAPLLALAARHRLPAIYSFRIHAIEGASSRMDRRQSISTVAQRRMWIASSRARSRPIFRCRRRPSTSWSSTSKPPRRSESTCRQRCSPAPTR